MSFLAKLKKETTECHVSLEKHLSLLERVQTTTAYRALLARFFTIYEPMEKILAPAADWQATHWDFSDRLKTPWLRDDLHTLGVTSTEMAAWARFDPTNMQLDGFGEAVGCLYVLEGSTLGGQMISKHFRDALGITPEQGGKFFRGYGDATVPRWLEFGTWAEAQATAAGGALEAPAIRAARSTFDAFSRWLT
jgi:heme oxygenase